MTLLAASLHLSKVSLVGIAVAGVVWIWAFVDLLAKPGWAWKAARRNKPAWAVVTFVLYILGALFYVLFPRGRVVEAMKTHHAPGTFTGAWQSPHDTSFGTGTPSDPRGAATAAPGFGTPYQNPTSSGGPFASQFGPQDMGRAAPYAASYPSPTGPTQPPGASPPPPSLPPAAWQPDPTGRHQLRYWDGAAWTDYVADNGVQTVDPLST